MERAFGLEWWKEAIFYEIYVRSFKDSNGDGVGDLPGIIEKLDYLSSLGVNGLWLTPINPSPDYDFGYDVTDYTAVNPLFGSMDDFDRLLEEAHARGIRIILDFVLNHTSEEHPWFQESRSSRKNSKRDWYIWRDGKAPGKRPNRWMNKILGSAWEFDPLTEQYYYHAFFKQQPDLNWRNPEVKEAMFDAATFWLEKGVDGFRLDLVNHLVEDEQLRENPLRCPLLSFQDLQEILPYEWQGHLYDRDQEETHTILKELRSLTDRYPGRMMVGEAMTFDPEVAVTYYGSGEDELHLVFNFRFITCSFNATKFFAAIEEWEKLLPSGAWPCLTLSNHDQARHIGRFGGSFGVHGLSPDAEARARVAAALLLTLRGTPFLYYGEEIGMPNCVVWPWEVKDPTGKIFWPAFQGRDLCRTPMQWEPSPQAGFTTGIPWLKVDKSYRCHNVAFQEEDACSLLNFYKKLIKLRREIPALSHGLIRLIPEAPSGSLSYLRSHSGEDVLVILNFRREGLPLKDLGDSPSLDQDKRWTVTFSSCRQEGVKLELNRAWLLPYEVLILS